MSGCADDLDLGLGWDDVAEMSDGEVYLALFPGRGVREGVFLLPDWGQVHRELARVIQCRRIRVREDRPGVSG